MAFRILFEESRDPKSCLDQMEFGSWLDFVFAHPAPAKGEERWYNLDGAERWHYRDSRLFLSRVTRLLREPDALLGRYEPAQIRQGFWCLVSAFELPDVLEDKEIDFGSRERCIQAMEPLYSRLFRREGYEKIAFYYWDPLTYSFSDQGGRCRDEDHARLKDAMFECLVQILVSRDRIPFLAAARALGHLHHSMGAEVIRRAVALHEGLEAADLGYARACARGEMNFCPPPRLGAPLAA